jgi:hypothetical protein
MLRLLRTLFASPAPLPYHVHYHFDDHGRRHFCDESACRPTHDHLGWERPLLSPYR